MARRAWACFVARAFLAAFTLADRVRCENAAREVLGDADRQSLKTDARD